MLLWLLSFLFFSYLDPMAGTKHEARAAESQAIGRAHRQGQSKQVTIVRFIIRNSIEYESYVQNYLETDSGNQMFPGTRIGIPPLPYFLPVSSLSSPVLSLSSLSFHTMFAEFDQLKKAPAGRHQLIRTASGRPKMLRATSIGAVLANSPSKLRSSGALIDMMEQQIIA